MSGDGLNSGARSIGRLALALIPWALGLGALVWLSVWIGIHEFRHTLSQEERSAIYTASQVRPKAKIVIEVIPWGCTTVTRTDLDGGQLVIYARNDCHAKLRYMEWHWQEVSPNGIVLHSGYTNGCSVPILPGDAAECGFLGYGQIDTDDRTEKLRVWTSESKE